MENMALLYQHSITTTGIPILTHNIPGCDTVRIAIVASLGAIHEEPFMGIMHFWEHMAFKGTHTRSRPEINKIIEKCGAKLNAETDLDSIAFMVYGVAEHASQLLHLLADLAINPILPQNELEQERGVILEEIRDGLDDPGEITLEGLDNLLFHQHNVGRNIYGTLESVQKITHDHLMSLHQKYIGPPNIFIVVVGQCNHQAIHDLAENIFSSCSIKTKPPVIHPAGNPSPVSMVVIKPSSLRQAHLRLGFRGPHIDNRQALAIRIIAQALFGDEDSHGSNISRLWELIREKMGLVYDMSAAYVASPIFGCLNIHSQFSPEKLQIILPIIFKEIEDVIANGLAADELALTQEIIQNRHRLDFDDKERIFRDLVDRHLYGPHCCLNNTFVNHDLGQITNQDIIETARRYLRPDLARIAVLQPA